MEEQLRKELMIAAAGVLGENVANRLEMAFTIVLHKYKVETKSTDVIVYDNSNERIIRNYIASLRLEGKSELTIDQYYRILNINNNWTYENLATTTKSTITYGNTIITYVPSIGMVNIKPNKLTNSVQISSWTTIVQIPEQYRPSSVIQFPVTVYNPEALAAYGQLTTDGNLQIYSNTPIKKDQGQAYYNFTYFI